MKLELNLPALERLIGGDTEIEIAIRRQIVEEFAKKHLKTLLNDEAWKRVAAVWKEDIEAQVREQLTTLLTERDEAAKEQLPYEHRWRLADAIKQSAQAAVDEALAGIIKWQKHEMTRTVREAVDAAMKKEIEAQVKEGVRKRLEAAAKAAE